MIRWAVFFASALVVFVLDRITKLWVLKEIAPKGIVKVTSFFNLVYVTNRGGAFGVGRHGNGALFIVASVAAIFVVVMLVKRIKRASFFVYIFLGMVLGGGVGNLYDRLVYGSVVDFLDFHLGSLHWPAFNVADTSIVVGVLLFALSYRGSRGEESASLSD